MLTEWRPAPRVRLRTMWMRHLLRTASRLEARARKLDRRAEDCRSFARRHLREITSNPYISAEYVDQLARDASVVARKRP